MGNLQLCAIAFTHHTTTPTCTHLHLIAHVREHTYARARTHMHSTAQHTTAHHAHKQSQFSAGILIIKQKPTPFSHNFATRTTAKKNSWAGAMSQQERSHFPGRVRARPALRCAWPSCVAGRRWRQRRAGTGSFQERKRSRSSQARKTKRGRRCAIAPSGYLPRPSTQKVADFWAARAGQDCYSRWQYNPSCRNTISDHLSSVFHDLVFVEQVV